MLDALGADFGEEPFDDKLHTMRYRCTCLQSDCLSLRN
jgi:hypothetical protein